MSKVKRINIKNAAYLITSNCQNRYPYFEEDVFCNLLIDNMAKCQKIKPFNLIGFKVNPDHVHLIIQPTGDYTISKIMQNIKRTTTDHINQIINFKSTDNKYEPLEWTERQRLYHKMIVRKNNYQDFYTIPLFKWQKSFDDRMIKTHKQLKNAIAYLKKQAVKHELKEDKFLYIADKIPKNIVFIGDIQ